MGLQITAKWSRAPLAHAEARAEMPMSPIAFSLSTSLLSCGSVRERPTSTSTRESAHAVITDGIRTEEELLKGSQRPTGQCACKSHKAGIADPIPAQTELRVRNMQEKIQRKCEKGRNG